MPGVTPAGGGIFARTPASAPSQEDLDDIDELLGDIDEDVRAEARPMPGRAPTYYQAWEELTATDGGYLLRHAGKIYAAIEVDAAEIVRQALAWQPAKQEDVVDA